MMLTEIVTNDMVENVESDDMIEEEFLEDDFESSTAEVFEVIALPSVRNLHNTSDNDAIIKLIDDLEEKNQIILDCSNRTKHRKVSKAYSKKSLNDSPAVRNEELKFEKQVPKLIMRPAAEDETVNHSTDTPGIVLFSLEKVRKCEVCDQEFCSDFRLKRHQLALHPLKDPITCCDQVFQFYTEYKRHSHPVMCPFCGKILKSRKTFLVHKRTHQTISERKFKCSYSGCVKAFSFKLHLDNHERTHSGT